MTRVVVRRQVFRDALPQAVTGCSVENLGKIREAYPDGVAVFVSKPGCPDCEAMRALLRKLVVPSRPVVEASLGDAACEAVADELKVRRTPVVVYYKGGAQAKRLEPDGTDGWAEFAAALGEMAS